MQIGDFQFKFSWGLLFGAVVLSTCLAGLGGWQLQRADTKRALQQEIEEKESAAPIQLQLLLGNHWKKWQYRQVILKGRFDQNTQFLMDNRIHSGKAGYHIITPFFLTGEKTAILVNRGWAEANLNRSILPKVKPPKGIVTIKGRVNQPRSKSPLMSDDDKPDAYSEKVWTHLDIDYAANISALEFEPYILLQESKTEDGLIRKWPKFEAKAAMHIGYAIQWFIFSFFCLVLFFTGSIKKAPNPGN